MARPPSHHLPGRRKAPESFAPSPTLRPRCAPTPHTGATLDAGALNNGASRLIKPRRWGGIGDYLAAIHKNLAIASLRRRVAAIVRQARFVQVSFDTKHPDIREVLRCAPNAIPRDLRQAAALTTLDIQKLVDVCGAEPKTCATGR